MGGAPSEAPQRTQEISSQVASVGVQSQQMLVHKAREIQQYAGKSVDEMDWTAMVSGEGEMEVTSKGLLEPPSCPISGSKMFLLLSDCGGA